MNYRKLGNSDLKVSVISMGTWKFDWNANRQDFLNICISANSNGINFFDTSNNYGGGSAEKFLGLLSNEIGRSNLIIGTKCFFPLPGKPDVKGLSEKNIIASVESSLKTINTDYIDVIQCHRPDPEVPIQETIAAMQKLKDQGKIRYWGLGANSAVRLTETALLAKSKQQIGPVSHQHVYNMFNRTAEAEILDYGYKYGMGLLAYSPLSQGVLTNKYEKGYIPSNSRAAGESRQGMWDLSPDKIEKAEQIADLCDNFSLPVSTVALAWCLRKVEVSSVITFCRNEEQLKENLMASELPLPAALLDEIEKILDNRPVNQYTNQPII